MQRNIQKAIIFPTFSKISTEVINKEYDLLYFGNEFCQNFTISFKNTKKILDLETKKIIILIPFLTQNKFKKYIKLLDEINQTFNYNKIEISTSDIGIIHYLNSKKIKLKKNISRPLSIEFVRMKEEILKKTLKELKINALEIDEEIFIEKLFKLKIPIHFHLPFGFVALQRHCIFHRVIDDKCNIKCIKNEIKLRIPYSKHFIYVRNNVYLKKIKIPQNINKVSRIIYWL